MICLAANPAEDATLVLDQLRPGTIHRPLEVSRRPGGKAVNVARAALALGAAPRLIALVGERESVRFEADLRAEGLDARIVAGGAALRRCTSLLDRANGAMTELYEAGDEVGDRDWGAFLAVAAAAADASVAVLAGSLPPGRTADTGALIAALGGGTSVALDTSGPALRAAAEAGGIETVKVNEAEARELLGGSAADVDELADALRAAFGPARTTAIVTAGPAGAALAAPDGSRLRATLAREPGRFPVGSGDAFLAGLLVARERGEPLERQLRLAIGAGAANAAALGAGTLDAELAEQLAAAAVVETA